MRRRPRENQVFSGVFLFGVRFCFHRFGCLLRHRFGSRPIELFEVVIVDLGFDESRSTCGMATLRAESTVGGCGTDLQPGFPQCVNEQNQLGCRESRRLQQRPKVVTAIKVGTKCATSCATNSRILLSFSGNRDCSTPLAGNLSLNRKSTLAARYSCIRDRNGG